MDLLTILLLVIAGVSIIGVIMTYALGKEQKARKGPNDSGVPQPIAKHKVALNPVFMAYILFTIIIVAVIAIAATYWGATQ
ncbi:hypothetical protein [Marinicrinis lubricantis]|uniref:Uncharacterized protein n=1 Tax=Marinicrinis lubricantis TaxID=2086470 RepID=A0ABW1IVH3_9BACL